VIIFVDEFYSRIEQVFGVNYKALAYLLGACVLVHAQL